MHSVGHRTAGTIAELDKELWSYYVNNVQSRELLKSKYHLTRNLAKRFKDRFQKDVSLIPFGSTVTNLGSNKSDLDLCVLSKSKTKRNTTNLLKEMRSIFKYYYSKQFSKTNLILQAKVPILRVIDFTDGYNNYTVDISSDNMHAIGIRNTHLLKSYGEVCSF